MATVQIRVPKQKHQGPLAMPASFFASGLVRGQDVQTVRALLTGAGYTPGVNEVQTITITGGPTGGTFNLTFATETTANLPHNATAAAVQTALRNLRNVGPQDVVCAGGPLPGAPVTVTFQGDYAANDVPEMEASHALTGGTNPDIVVAETTKGSTKGKLVRFGTERFAGRPGQFRYCWLFAFPSVTSSTTPVPFTLKVFAVDRHGANIEGASDTVNFEAEKKDMGFGAPVIGYPEPGYDIEGGERQSFMPFGTSDVPMSGVTLGGVDADFTGYDPEIEMWYSVLPDLEQTPGPGDYSLTATNVDGSTSRGVTVADH